MAFVHVLTKWPEISEKNVGTTGAHRDESTTLRLAAIALRNGG